MNNICFILFLGCLLFPILLNFNFNLTKAAITVKILKFPHSKACGAGSFVVVVMLNSRVALPRGEWREREKPSSFVVRSHCPTVHVFSIVRPRIKLPATQATHFTATNVIQGRKSHRRVITMNHLFLKNNTNHSLQRQ